MKIGVGITTFNSESYCQELYDSLPFDRIDELVICNGGDRYEKPFENAAWIQHNKRQFASVARNDCLRYLMERDCDYYFIIEDDMLIKNPDVFNAYIEASRRTGLQYMHFASNAWHTGPVGARTPRLQVQYSPTMTVNFYQHMCNEFTFRTKKCLTEVGLYDKRFQFTFDVDFVIRHSQYHLGTPMFYFPDIANADDFVMNNPNAISRMNPNGERDNQLQDNMLMLKQKHGVFIHEIEDASKDDVVERLQYIKTHEN